MERCVLKETLVTVVVPTKNSENFIEACLKSIKNQSYSNIEIIVIDNFSDDETPKLAKTHSDTFAQKGPERSSQRNYGVTRAKGKYVLIVDSDMELSKDVVRDCVDAITKSKNVKGVIIPEESFGEGFWAQCKKLEKSFYIGIDWIEAARFFTKKDYEELGGYNEEMISGEDWDLSRRMNKGGSLERVSSLIYHNEGKISLLQTLKKKIFYASKISAYIDSDDDTSNQNEILLVFKRFFLYLSQPVKLFRNPFVGIGMLLMKILEFGFGFFGFIKARLGAT